MSNLLFLELLSNLLYEKFSYALHKVRLPSQVLQHEEERQHEHIDQLWKAGEVKNEQTRDVFG